MLSAILAQPLLFCLLIWTRIQKYSYFIYKKFELGMPIDPGTVAQLLGWIVLGVGVLTVIGLIIKFVVEGSDIETGEMKEIYAAAGNMLWRLFAVLILYLIVAALLYLFAGFTQMVTKEMEYVPRGR